MWHRLAPRIPWPLAPVFDLAYNVARYYRTFGTLPNLAAPRRFTEHVNRKKLFDRRPLLTLLADKYGVREYVRRRVGEEHLAELFLVCDDPRTIDFASLPDSFVIKATHGCFWTTIVPDKTRVDLEAVRDECAGWLACNYYDVKREWCYRDIKPRIVVEEFLGDVAGETPNDYKFFCFGGVARFVQVDVSRFGEHTRDFYDRDWQRLDVRLVCQNHPCPLPRPDTLVQMISVAERLARGLDFVRVDLYSVRDRVVFGEMTNYPGRGFGRFEPRRWDWVFGSYWV